MEKSFLEKRKADIEYNLDVINEKIAESAIKSGRNPSDIQLMAVTKTVDPIFINYALDYGVNMIGENRVQEMLRKSLIYIFRMYRSILSVIFRPTRQDRLLVKSI